MARNIHYFEKADEVKALRKSLLNWYDANKRDLPWRRMAVSSELDSNQKAYAVWVSEIMLQQTQVATVISYYNKWMKKWPALQDLAMAKLEDVNEMWSGLGYYSRGRRLHEGAMKVVNELEGEMPRSADDLQRHLPGVGKYTGSAIASIVFKQNCGVVDGNVLRVFSRMRSIGAEITSQAVTDAIWTIVGAVVDADRPGDFNQSVMELGATVCTPKAPKCASCPVSDLCRAKAQVDKVKQQAAAKLTAKRTDEVDIEDICLIKNCDLCLPLEDQWDSSLGVMNYPRKKKKKAPREEVTGVCVLSRFCLGSKETEYLITQRPPTGLLANLWEFVSVDVDRQASPEDCKAALIGYLEDHCHWRAAGDSAVSYVDSVVHIFSHIHKTYMVYKLTLTAKDDLDDQALPRASRWVTQPEIAQCALSTAMRKVLKKVTEVDRKPTKRPRKDGPVSDGKKQMSLGAFLKPKAK